VHNRRGFTRDCVLSLRNQGLQDFTTIVVDDGSSDGTSEMIKMEFREVILLRGEGNLWWAGATNLGIRYALDRGAKYILTLNDDTLVYPDFIEKMWHWVEKTPCSLLGALAIDSRTKQPVYGGEVVNWLTASYVSVLEDHSLEDLSGLREVTHFSGRGLFIPAVVFREIGLFDSKRFPQTVADYDFTHRARKAGFRVYCNYDARLLTHTWESGDAKLRRDKSWPNYWSHLFGIKGGGNLKYFTLYAIKNCPAEKLPFFLILGLLRRTCGYLIEWVKDLSYSQK
jgi:GT2 family glycosyltransferase